MEEEVSAGVAVFPPKADHPLDGMIEAQEVQLRCTRQFVITVKKTVKCLSGQPVVSLFFAAVVLKTTAVLVLIQEDLKVEVLKTDKCLMRSVMSVGIVAKFLFSQAVENRFIAVIVLG